MSKNSPSPCFLLQKKAKSIEHGKCSRKRSPPLIFLWAAGDVLLTAVWCLPDFSFLQEAEGGTFFSILWSRIDCGWDTRIKSGKNGKIRGGPVWKLAAIHFTVSWSPPICWEAIFVTFLCRTQLFRRRSSGPTQTPTLQTQTLSLYLKLSWSTLKFGLESERPSQSAVSFVKWITKMGNGSVRK